MSRFKSTPFLLAPLAAALVLAPQAAVAKKDVAEFSETSVIIEINASDGDVGFHAKYDADAWWWVTMRDPMGKKIVREQASKALADSWASFFDFCPRGVIS